VSERYRLIGKIMSRNPLALIGVQTNSTDHASGNLAISGGGQIILWEVTVSDVRERAGIDQAPRLPSTAHCGASFLLSGGLQLKA